MASNEAMELLENVLSSVNESERAIYRALDIEQKKLQQEINELEDERTKERKKVEEYHKDPNRYYEIMNELEKKRQELDHTKDHARAVFNPMRNGTNEYGEKAKSGNTSSRHTILTARTNYELNKQPKNKELHDRINKRTKLYDTTAKHEACMILIEALNTLLNE
jgi:chromosome segregation ATPase